MPPSITKDAEDTTSTQSKSLKSSALSQTCGRSVFLLVLVSLLILATSCSNEDKPIEEPTLKGIISSYNEYDGAMLDFTKADMDKTGFTLGDVISITIDDKTFVMPYYDGYYTPSGELLLVAYPSYPSICFTVCNTGLPKELMGLEGHSVTVKMKEKGGCLDVQTAMSLTYTNSRDKYPTLSNAEFANARAVSTSNIASGVLYRCSTPFTDEICRDNYVSEYLESQKVKTVLNLADTEEKMLSYDMPPFSRTLWEGGNVILCPLKADPTADDFNNRLIAALKELPSRPALPMSCIAWRVRTAPAMFVRCLRDCAAQRMMRWLLTIWSPIITIMASHRKQTVMYATH